MKPKAQLIGDQNLLKEVFAERILEQIGGLTELNPEHVLTHRGGITSGRVDPETEIIFSTWGMLLLDEELLAKLPKLKAVFYAAGTVKYFCTPEQWARGVRIFSAAAANAVPVAEFTVGQIILGLKRIFELSRLTRESGWKSTQGVGDDTYGNYESTVGLVSYGLIGRLVRKHLRTFEHRVIVYDPFLSQEIAEKEEIELVGLDELFRQSDAISVHTPLLPETVKMIKGRHFEMMKNRAIFINTSRGKVIDQSEMTEALKKRDDILAFLDVLEQEPPEDNDPLLSMKNVQVTPHVAGSFGPERVRLAAYMLTGLKMWLNGETCEYEIREEQLSKLA